MKRKKINTKKELAIILSSFNRVKNPKRHLEQYYTQSEDAADILWHGFIRGRIVEKTIADFGAGDGTLGLGAALLGAKKVFLIEKDKESLLTAKSNAQKIGVKNIVFLNIDVTEFSQSVDTVIQNPPFGHVKHHADRAFLKKATELSNFIYTIHKASTLNFVKKLLNKTHQVEEVIYFQYKLPQRFNKDYKKIHSFDAACVIAKRISQ